MTAPDASSAQRIAVKLFAEGDAVPASEFRPIFHRFIQHKALPGLLIDVVDYSHVAHGPGVVLIGHESNLATDEADGRAGLLLARKRDEPGGFDERLRVAVKALLDAATKLAHEPSLVGRLRWSGRELLVRVHDRLHAPNDALTRSALGPSLSTLSDRLYGATARPLDYRSDARAPFSARLG